MPKEFEDAVKAGGRVRTISGPNKQFGLSAGEYVRIVFHKGKMIRGEVHSNKAAVKEVEKHVR